MKLGYVSEKSYEFQFLPLTLVGAHGRLDWERVLGLECARSTRLSCHRGVHRHALELLSVLLLLPGLPPEDPSQEGKHQQSSHRSSNCDSSCGSGAQAAIVAVVGGLRCRAAGARSGAGAGSSLCSVGPGLEEVESVVLNL